MNARQADSFPGMGRLIGISLLFPAAALVLFHWVNLSNLDPDTRWRSGFLGLPLHFILLLPQLRFALPNGLFVWSLKTAIGLLPFWLLGWGLLRRALSDRVCRGLAAIPAGLGLAGVALELLAMAGWFTGVAIWTIYFAAGLAGLALSCRSLANGSETPVSCSGVGGSEGPVPAGPIVPCSGGLRAAAWALFVFLAALVVEHALFFPENYWDALIYYLYYAKLIFLNSGIPFPVDPHGFPELVQCQVGLGLGANYAHLFLLWQASVCKAFGTWSSYPGQWMGPVCGIATALLIYRIVLLRWRSERLALWSLLIVESVPYWLWYQSWVSDYPLAVWFAVSAIALVLFGREGSPRLAGLAAVATAGSHLNYLMTSLWLFPLAAWIGMGRKALRGSPLAIILVGVTLSSTWYIRNEVVTGNPVYAFFPRIFGGINTNLDVLKSCEVEWTSNGDGLATMGQTLGEKILATPRYFLFDKYMHLKWAILPLGWFLPGLFVFLLKTRKDLAWFVLTIYGVLLLFYHYVISSLYLYHIMPLVPIMVLIGCHWAVFIDQWPSKIGRLTSVLVLGAAITVGLPAAMLGPKFSSPNLHQTLSPGIDPEYFNSVAIEEYKVWQIMNDRLPPGAVVLTHENRHYYLRDDIHLLHLDDYRLIPWYGRPAVEVEKRLHELGVGFYLRIGNERNHPILQQLGIDRLLGKGFVLLYERGNTKLYQLQVSKL